MTPGPQASFVPQRLRPGFTALFLAASLVYLYLLLFIPPATPILVGTDGCVHLADAQRMLGGQVLYRDFFNFVTPATDWVYYGLFRLLGPRLWIPNVVLMAIGLAFAWLTLVISRHVMRPRAALLPAALFLVIPFGRSLDPAHHWFSALAVVAAIAVLLDKRTLWRIATAGAFCGLATGFTLSRGLAAVVGLGVFLLWERRRNKQPWSSMFKSLSLLVAGFLLAIVAVSAYSVWKAGLARFLYCTVVFGAKYYSADVNANTWRVFFSELQPIPPWRNLALLVNWIFLHGVVPLSYLLFFLRNRRQAPRFPQIPWPKLMLVAIVGTALFLGTAPAPAMHRVAADSLPALILLGWLLDSDGRIEKLLTRGLWAGIVFMVVAGLPVRQFGWRGVLQTPRGQLATLDRAVYNEYSWLLRHTRPQEYVFVVFYAEPYFYLDLRNPTTVPFLTGTDYTRPEQVLDVIRDLEKREVRYVVWIGEEKDARLGHAAPGDHLDPLRIYLQGHYHLVKVFPGSTGIWERNTGKVEGLQR